MKNPGNRNSSSAAKWLAGIMAAVITFWLTNGVIQWAETGKKKDHRFGSKVDLSGSWQVVIDDDESGQRYTAEAVLDHENNNVSGELRFDDGRPAKMGGSVLDDGELIDFWFRHEEGNGTGRMSIVGNGRKLEGVWKDERFQKSGKWTLFRSGRPL